MKNVVITWIRGIQKQSKSKRKIKMLADRLHNLNRELMSERTMRQMWQERYYALAKITREVIEEHERSIIDTDAWENENENHA